MGFLLIQRAVLATAVLSALALPAHADQMPAASGVIAIATEPVSIKTVSLEGNIIGRTGGVGNPIYLNDEIKTGPQSKLQILLKDQTVFNIGPNSSLKIDKFVYDPVRPQLSVNIERGAFKFVSGKISNGNPDAMKVKLPNATIAVRGTGVAGEVAPDGASTVVLLHGTVDVTSTASSAPGSSSTASTATLSKSGWGVQVGSTGNISSPSQLPADAVRSILQKVGSIGNVPTTVTASNTAINSSTVNTTNEANSLASTLITANNNTSVSDLALKVVSPSSVASATSATSASSLATGVSQALIKPVNPYLDTTLGAGSAASITSTATIGTQGGAADYIKSLGVTIDPGADINAVIAKLTPEQQQVISDAHTDEYLLVLYPDDVAANHFTSTYASTQQSANLYTALNASTITTPYTVNGFNTSNFGGTTPTASYQFNIQNVALSCLVGASCGAPLSAYVTNGMSASVVSQTVVLNFAAASIYNAYNVSYSGFGVGSRINSGSYTGAFSSSFANLALAPNSQAGNNYVIVLPTDPSQTNLQMLGSFGPGAGGAGMTGVFSTAINTQIGTSSTASLQATYTADGVETSCDIGCDIDNYLTTNYPLQNFTSTNVNTQLQNQLQNALIANSLDSVAFSATDFKTNSMAPQNLGTIRFQIPGHGFNLTCLTGGNSCGSAGGVNAWGQVGGAITINYTTQMLTNAYNYIAVNFGLGHTQFNGNNPISGSASSSFADLTSASGPNGKTITLPVAASDAAALKMLGSFAYSPSAGHSAIISAAIMQSAGSKTISLIGTSGVVAGAPGH